MSGGVSKVFTQADRCFSTEYLCRVKAGFEAAIAEAAQTMGATSPNPAVGCTLLDEDGALLVTEAHRRAGDGHAEVRALEKARALGVLERVVTALVTLEPCNHRGSTPPCTEALLESPVRQVWMGVRDPNPVAQGGYEQLRNTLGASSVIVLGDLLQREGLLALSRVHHGCRALIAPFACRMLNGRPWLTVKQAVDQKGSMIPPLGQKTFTDESSLRLAHQMRRATDAIITGVGTVLSDAPQFTVRRVPDHANRAPRLLVVCARTRQPPLAWCHAVERHGFQLVITRELTEIPSLLAGCGVNWALVEAGPRLLAEVKRLALWDDWVVLASRDASADQISLETRLSARDFPERQPGDVEAQAGKVASPMDFLIGNTSSVCPSMKEY